MQEIRKYSVACDQKFVPELEVAVHAIIADVRDGFRFSMADVANSSRGPLTITMYRERNVDGGR